MRNLLLTLRFDGTAYCGYQVQKNGVTVAGVVQDAVAGLFGARLPITGCSRTDAGVHADKYCLNFRTDSAIPCERIIPALNVRLPRDIAVYGCREVPLDFHARYSCRAKRYCYTVYNAPARNPFYERTALHDPRPLDAELLDRSARAFVGTHDFTAFCAAGGSVIDKVRTVSHSAVERDGDLVRFTVQADGFLYNMVRIMAGTLLDIAAGRIAPDAVPAILAGRDRSAAGQTAPAHGLMLTDVVYAL